MVKVPPKIEKKFMVEGIEVQIYKTAKACEMYTKVRGHKKVAAILHIFD